MAMILYNRELLELLKNFYILTGIRIVLFDEDYNELLSYPEGNTGFCALLRKNPEFDCLCVKSDASLFKECRKKHSLIISKCHAGLIEATAPIIDNGIILGYIMFGQVRDNKNKREFINSLTEICKKYSESTDISGLAEKIRYKNKQQIIAASKILEACTSYIIHKEYIKPSKRRLTDRIEKYIDEHLSESLTVSVLCSEFNISRTRLYELIGKQISGGIASYIRQKRLNVAAKLVLETKMSFTDIAYSVGFNDYNYFLRVFKTTFNISPKKMRQL